MKKKKKMRKFNVVVKICVKGAVCDIQSISVIKSGVECLYMALYMEAAKPVAIS